MGTLNHNSLFSTYQGMTFQTASDFSKTLMERKSKTTFHSSATLKIIKGEYGTFKSTGQTGNLLLNSCIFFGFTSRNYDFICASPRQMEIPHNLQPIPPKFEYIRVDPREWSHINTHNVV